MALQASTAQVVANDSVVHASLSAQILAQAAVTLSQAQQASGTATATLSSSIAALAAFTVLGDSTINATLRVLSASVTNLTTQKADVKYVDSSTATVLSTALSVCLALVRHGAPGRCHIASLSVTAMTEALSLHRRFSQHQAIQSSTYLPAVLTELNTPACTAAWAGRMRYHTGYGFMQYCNAIGVWQSLYSAPGTSMYSPLNSCSDLVGGS